MSDDRKVIKRALISVYDKTGLEALAASLHGAGVEIVSTGSTAATIAGQGIPVTPVEELTGFPECLEGRVKTLHPKVHAVASPTPARKITWHSSATSAWSRSSSSW